MSELQKVIDEINAADMKSPHWLEDELPDYKWKEIATVNPDEHRWYVISTLVFEVAGGLIGVRGPTSMKSESMDWADIGAGCTAFEMEAVPSVTYKRKAAEKDANND